MGQNVSQIPPGDLSLAGACRIGRIPSRASFRQVTGDADQIETAGSRDPTAVVFLLGAGRPVGPGGWGATVAG